ncbi:HisA/HisF-related TIM barrel protein [bacterium]|nr:HisA/HisF-related TIM barrel protein [bacterium]
MLIIPAIDIKKDKIVRLYKGDFNKISHYEPTPEDAFIQYLTAKIERLHLIFLWGAYSGNISPEEEQVIDKIINVRDIYAKNTCTIQIGGGMRSSTRISELIKKGVDYIIVGTAFIIPLAFEEGFTKNDIKMFYQAGGKEFNQEKELPEFGLPDCLEKDIREKIIVSIDYRQEETALSGWQVTIPLTPHYLIKEFMKKGYKRFILTNVEKDGTLEGIDIGSIKNILGKLAFDKCYPEEIIIAGGVTSEKDIQKLMNLKYKPSGVIIGKALYQQRFDLKTAVAKFQLNENQN